ncbi:MAG: trimethylamine methyltransferase family protein, partial [Armatimonadota bacterium]
MKLQMLKVLSDDEIKRIHEATLDILANCGVKVLNRRMLDFLSSKGLCVDFDSQIVRFSQTCIEDALSTIPKTFDVFDREGRFAFTLGDGYPRVAAGHNAVFWVDAETGETRPSTVSDVEVFARICDKLEHVDVLGIPVMPQDVPDPHATLVFAVKACID